MTDKEREIRDKYVQALADIEAELDASIAKIRSGDKWLGGIKELRMHLESKAEIAKKQYELQKAEYVKQGLDAANTKKSGPNAVPRDHSGAKPPTRPGTRPN